MKPIPSLFALALCLLSLSLPGQTATNSNYTYTIHVGTFVTAQPTDFNSIQQFGFVYAEQFRNNLMQVYLGGFPTESEAEQLLPEIKVNGYPDAYVTRRDLQQGEKQYVIQLALAGIAEDINWERYLRAGPLFVLLQPRQTKIVTGVFDSAAEANQRLTIVKRLGFDDAFVKGVNSVLLHRVSTFEAGREIVAPPTGLVVAAPDSGPAVEEPAISPVTTEPSPPPAEVIPESYDEVLTARGDLRTAATVEKKPTPVPSPEVLPLPQIRKNVKRTSAIELQKVLKRSGHYRGSLDGLYGPGTRAAYDQWMSDSDDMHKYQMLNQHQEEWLPELSSGPLQDALHLLGEQPAPALRYLEQSASPLALAYRAYQGFHTRGAQRQVDLWMNQAIETAFADQVKSSITFDPTATYAYRDLNQILHHLAQIHSVTEAEAAVPCWLFQRHPEAASNAFATVSTYRMEDCDRFTQWESLQVAQVIARELDPNPRNSRSMAQSYASIRAG